MSAEHGHAKSECREVFARLSDYLDGELEPGICDSFEGHLDDCSPCQVFLESLRRTVGWIAALPTPPLPEEVRFRVRDAIGRLDRDRRG